jgi:hypothetical protein
MVIVPLGLVQYGIAARRPATGEGQGVQYPVPRSLNLVNTSTTSLASRNAHWTGDGISPIGQHVKAASKQKKKRTARYDTRIDGEKRQKRKP